MKKVLKKIFIVIVILAVLFIVWRVSLFVFVKNIEKKTFENFQGDYYYKITSNSGISREFWSNEKHKVINLNGSTEIWQDREKKIYLVMPKGGDSATIKYEIAVNPAIEYMDMFDNGESAYITNWTWDNSVKWHFMNWSGNLVSKICDIFRGLVEEPLMTIKNVTTEVVNNKECYKIELGYNIAGYETYYIEKETALPIRTIQKNIVQSRSGENWQEEIYMQEFEYSFDKITDESLEMPSLDNCYVLVEDNM